MKNRINLKTDTIRISTLATGLAILAAHNAAAYPVDPAKVPVNGIDLSQVGASYTLAWDSADKGVVYFAPKTGRIALYNGMPMIGFGKLVNGNGVLNAQFEFEIASVERAALLGAIRQAGFTPVPFPFFKTTVRPILQGWDSETGKRKCEDIPDLSSGEIKRECDASLFDSISYIKGGPTLGENIAISAMLNQTGAAIMGAQLAGGDAFQVALVGEYYTAGDAFTASVDVNYDKLYESFSAYAGFKGFLTSADVEAFWSKETLCGGKPASECSVQIHYKDSRGRPIENVTVGPNDTDADKLLQAVNRLRQKLEDDMLTPISPVLGKADANAPKFGWKYNAKFESRRKEMHAHFEFASVRGVNTSSTTIVGAAACIRVLPSGAVSRETQGDCGLYWSGSIGFDELVKRRANEQ